MFPGGSADEDVHEDADHMYFFLDGTGYSMVEGEKLEYGPGDCLFIPRGAKHSMVNTGKGTLKMVASFGPARKAMRK
jgi:mannose-6-phosphate isomerase-like protein (cupin superfamily)